ncbi:AbrB family transcriptional regulator [Jeotgalibaca sp. A122]|uniref:AbrB family transcriptional regulator n=1 Tax=Jeotgalibaca sp. A122 TaxID=3457322 RepID=UPI003FCFA945
MDLVLTIGMGVLGAYLGRRFKVPASFMLGPMFAVAVFNILTDGATYPTFMKNFTQMVSGTFIGAGISKKDVKLLRKMIIPAILNIVVLIIFSLLMALVLAKVGGFSFATAAFATAPGGLVDMVIVSLDMGADPAIVSVMQTVRLFSIIGLFPAIFSRMISKGDSLQDTMVPQKVAEQKRGRIWLTALIGMVGGVIGFFSGVPAGPLIFSMIAVGAQNISTQSAVMPVQIKQIAQISAGILIGSSIHFEAILALKDAIVPAIIMIVGYLTLVVVMASFFYKTGKLSLATALFSCAPGGASDLALLAIDYNANAAVISLMQTFRMVMVITFYPTAILLVNNLLQL